MGDHFVMLVDRLLTESTLEAAIESINSSFKETENVAIDDTVIDFSSYEDSLAGASPRKLEECRICQDEDFDLHMETPCSCRGSLKEICDNNTKIGEGHESLQRPTMVNLYAMNAGKGVHSYIRNSSYQRGVVDYAKPIIEQEIATKLDINQLYSPTTTNGFCIADFGCSTGGNSFPAMEIICQALTKKFKTEGSSSIILKRPKFLVFFNDSFSNDFNTLFGSLPRKCPYLVTGLPGNFYGRLLPDSSLHFAYSSWSLHWLTEVPKAVIDPKSPAWNKGAILCAGDNKEVCDAFSKQHEKDLESFLEARAQELVVGGMMALLIPGVPSFWDPTTEYTIPSDVNLLSFCLQDMAKQGKISEKQIDSLNIPYYFTTPEKLKTVLERCQSFTTETMEILDNPGKHTLRNVNERATFFRAVHEKIFVDHFGSEIIDELFEKYMKRLEASPVFINPSNDKSIVILVVLKRKTN